MATVPAGDAGRKLHKRMLANRAHLFVFMSNRAVPYTNNVSERHLRPSVIFRKVTNGFRCEWGRKPTPPSAPSSAPPRQTALRCSTLSGSCSQPNDPGSRSLGQGEQLQISRWMYDVKSQSSSPHLNVWSQMTKCWMNLNNEGPLVQALLL